MKTTKHLDVTWADQSWEVAIRNVQAKGCVLGREGSRPVRSRFEPVVLPPSSLPFFPLENFKRPVPMKLSSPRLRGFTLIELLVVIGIIAILAAIALPVLTQVKTKAKIAQARTEMQGLAASIKQYENDYNRYPASPDAEKDSANTDFTYGTKGLTLVTGSSPIENGPPRYEANNSELVLILLDIDQGVNLNHVRNPRKNKYWNAKMVSSDIGGVSTVDYVARDPFGNPYMITLDMNDDNKCLDAMYRKNGVSSKGQPNPDLGHYGLSRRSSAPPPPPDSFELNAPVMIWSFGPDKAANLTDAANAGLNRDNILSWAN